MSEEFGLCGDRGWALRDEEAGEIVTARRLRSLVQYQATYVAEPSGGETPPVEITSPDGVRVRTDDPQGAQRLSELLDHPVTVWPRQSPTDLEHFRRRQHLGESNLGELLDLEPGEALPDYVFDAKGRPIIPEFVTRPGTYVDVVSVSLVTTTALQTLAEHAPGSDVAVQRFRKNIVLDDIASSAYPEFDWVGQQLTLGTVGAEVVGRIGRCVIVTLPQQALPQDRQLLRTIAHQSGMEFGVALRIHQPGVVREGDPVELVSVPSA